MPKKIKSSKFDWDLEVELVMQPDETTAKTEIVKCVKVMNSENYDAFIDHVRNTVPKAFMDNVTKDGTILEGAIKAAEQMEDGDKGIKLMIRQIDWLYGRGVDWWASNVEPTTIGYISQYLLSYSKEITEKKK